MRLTELWERRARPTISFEFFPAREDKGRRRLAKTLDKLSKLEPDFVSVTFGAGGSTREGSYDLVRRLMREHKHQVLAYFGGWSLGPSDIRSVLDDYAELGVKNLLAVRGDMPHEDEGIERHPMSFDHASDVLEFIGQNYDFCLGAAAHPEGHPEATSRESDLGFHKLKVDKGARFLICNYQFDNAFYFDFVERLRGLGVDVPILPGILPIFSVAVLENMAKLAGASVTPQLSNELRALRSNDKAAVLELGIDFAYRQCVELLEAGVPGLHFYTLDRSKATLGVVQRLRADRLI